MWSATIFPGTMNAALPESAQHTAADQALTTEGPGDNSAMAVMGPTCPWLHPYLPNAECQWHLQNLVNVVVQLIGLPCQTGGAHQV